MVGHEAQRPVWLEYLASSQPMARRRHGEIAFMPH
jgi:hypothetical protein